MDVLHNDALRTQSLPGAPKEQVAADAPILVGLLEQTSEIIIYTPSSPYWEEVRHVFNLTVLTQPLAVVRPTSNDALCIVVRFCSSNKISISVRNGGHDFDGRNLVSNGVVIDVRSLDWIKIAENRETARIGGGVLSGKLLKFLDCHDLFTPIGWCSSVGYVGWAVGGGYGSYAAYYGMGVDQIVSAQLATANGSVIDVETDDELLWALRGAANGNLGIIIELRIKIYPKPPLLAGIVTFPAIEMEQVLGRFQSLCEDSFPNNFSGEGMYVGAPNNQALFIFTWTWVAPDGNLKPGWDHLAKVTSLGTVLSSSINETYPVGFLDVMDDLLPHASTSYIRSRSVKQFSPDLIRIFAKKNPPQGSLYIIHNCHGIATKKCSQSSFANRAPHLVIGIAGLLPNGTSGDDIETELVINWVDATIHDIMEQGLALTKGYPNFTPDRDMDVVQFFGEDTNQRLKEVKKKYDPNNVFFRGYPCLSPS